MKLIRIASCLIMIFSACVWNCEASRVQHNRTLSSAECRSIFGSERGECVLDWNCEAYDTCAAGNLCLDCDYHLEETNIHNGWTCGLNAERECSSILNLECLSRIPCKQSENFTCVTMDVPAQFISGNHICADVPVE